MNSTRVPPVHVAAALPAVTANPAVKQAGVHAWGFDNVLVHRLTIQLGPWIADANLPMHLSSTNSGGLASVRVLNAHQISISRLGPQQSNGRFRHLGPAVDTTVKGGPGYLHRITVNSTSGPGGTATIYDSLTPAGSIIAVIDLTKASLSTQEFGCDFSIGLTVRVLGGGGSGDLTVIFD